MRDYRALSAANDKDVQCHGYLLPVSLKIQPKMPKHKCNARQMVLSPIKAKMMRYQCFKTPCLVCIPMRKEHMEKRKNMVRNIR
jgi:hypothetical protein